MSGYTYETDAHRELYFLSQPDIKRLKRIFMIPVNAFGITDQNGWQYNYSGADYNNYGFSPFLL